MSAEDWPITIDSHANCWLWEGPLDPRGYPYKWLGGRKRAWAHRHVYEAEVGPVPKGLELDHQCRVRRCVSPVHLEPVTRLENMRRQAWRYRIKRKACPLGHSLRDYGLRTEFAGIVCGKCSGVRT